MARYLIPSDATIRATKPHDKPFRLNDGDGLYLLIRPEGGPKGGWWWRFDYSFHGRRKTLSLGTYPDTGLQLARGKTDEARKLVEADTDPSDIRKADKAKHADQREAERRKDAGIPPVNSDSGVGPTQPPEIPEQRPSKASFSRLSRLLKYLRDCGGSC